MTTMVSQITSLTVVYSAVYSDADQRKHQSSASLAFVWGIHRDRWIPRTKGQLRGKCFHLMTSSWDRIVRHFSNQVHRKQLCQTIGEHARLYGPFIISNTLQLRPGNLQFLGHISEINCLVKRVSHFDSHIFPMCHKCQINDNPALVQIVDWCPTREKWISEVTRTLFTEAYTRPLAPFTNMVQL